MFVSYTMSRDLVLFSRRSRGNYIHFIFLEVEVVYAFWFLIDISTLPTPEVYISYQQYTRGPGSIWEFFESRKFWGVLIPWLVYFGCNALVGELERLSKWSFVTRKDQSHLLGVLIWLPMGLRFLHSHPSLPSQKQKEEEIHQEQIQGASECTYVSSMPLPTSSSRDSLP